MCHSTQFWPLFSCYFDWHCYLIVILLSFYLHGVHQFLIVKFHDFLMTFSGAIDIFSWPLRVKFNDFFRTQKRRRRENFFRYLRKMNVFEELSEIAKKSWLFQVFKVFSWLVFAFHDFFQVLQVFQDYQVFQVSGHHD